MRKLGRFLVLVLLCGTLVLLGGFLALGMYYQNNFPVNTWINGVYCTGKTIEEAAVELAAQTVLSDVAITDASGRDWRIAAQDLSVYPDYTAALRSYMRKNASAMWMRNMKAPAVASLEPTQYRWDEVKLEEAFRALSFVREEAERETGCRIEFDEESGYYLEDGNRQRLNSGKCLNYIRSCLSEGRFSIRLSETSCYEELEDNAADAAQRALWGQLQDYYDCKLTYDMGAEQIPFTPALLSSFLRTDGEGRILPDDAGQLVVDGEKTALWVEELAARYNTSGTEREFSSTRGDKVPVKYSTYGTKINEKAEKKYLLEALAGKRTEPEIHVPAYLQQGFARGLDDIGRTYIEIDMTQQHLYYYMDGELRLDTDIVTGNMSRRWGTPAGINFVYAKQRNRVLRGEGYASPVKYWMPVKGAIGIHDADWRTEFGGEIYKKSGSHGCINIPPKVMPELYEMVEVGTPVVMFY